MSIADVIELIREYGDVNFQTCTDNILLDPVLSGKGFTPENIEKSESMQVISTIHSAKYHACQDLIALIERRQEGGNKC